MVKSSAGDLLKLMPAPGESVELSGLGSSSAAFVLTRMLKQSPGSYLVFCPTPIEAEDFVRDMEFFWPEGAAAGAIRLLPGYEVKPFQDQSPPPELVFARLDALYALMTGQRPLVVAASAESALQLSLPPSALSEAVDFLETGQEVDREAFVARLVSAGYFSSPLVQGPGDFSVRGGILDLYPPKTKRPVRAEFFGDYVDSLRTFRTLDQRSVDDIEELVVLPASEVVFKENRVQRAFGSFRDRANEFGWPGDVSAHIEDGIAREQRFAGLESYLPLFYDRLYSPAEYADSSTVRVIFEPERFKETGRDHLDRLETHIEEVKNQGRPYLDLGLLYHSVEAFEAALTAKPIIEIRELEILNPDFTGRRFAFHPESHQDLRAVMDQADKGAGLLGPLAARIKSWLKRDLDIVLVCHTEEQARRMAALLEDYELHPALDFSGRTDPDGRFRLVKGFLSSGFVSSDFSRVFVTEDEIFGAKRRFVRRAVEEIKGVHLSSFQDLAVGDFVVHKDHGVAQYQGLVKLDVRDLTNDFLHLVYRGGDKLYVPVDRFGAVQKYIGTDGRPPRLDKLGGEVWERVKSRIKASLREMTRELVRLYASRKINKGHRFSPRDSYFQEFEASFEFEETPDQLAAINDVLADMETEKPMDRLVCGDVGFGKTEVALRAAFKAVLDGKQVGILAPTTVLVEQHYQSFTQRFKNYPVRVESLSRFKNRTEQKEALAKLAAGQVDVIIGTHRLLSKDVQFKDLGLVVIDEEHRFGVAQKERLKKLRVIVDVLTLSATPIPRTLQMSLTGIRDLSTIETPPQDRQSIKSYLLKYDERTIIEAITQEIDRGGQVFFVHNRVKDIYLLAGKLTKLMPLARFGVAHGQQKERDLERVMLSFLRKEIDVLVTTTIIESGLDIPTANTIIINNADKFGLAQIYQLRGRVGRSDVQAYAYLMFSSQDRLTATARKRLKALMEFTDLGSGFKIALHDLQIRGAGHLLGEAQSGQIAAVGYEMYLQLMEEAIREIKGEKYVEEVDPEMVMDLPAYIPDEYVPDTEQRLVHYRRFASLKSPEELAELMEELKDRYGPPIEEVNNLEQVIGLKLLLKKAGIRRMEMGRGGLTVAFVENGRTDPEKIIGLAKDHPDEARFYPDGRLFLSLEGLSGVSGINKVRNLLQQII